MRFNYTILLAFFLILLTILSCKKDPDQPEPEPCDPSNVVCLANSLKIKNAAVRQGNPPSPSSSSNAPDILNSQGSARVTADNTLYIPFYYRLYGGSTLGGIYIQIIGANSYFDIPASGATIVGNTLVIPLDIPANILLGDFRLAYCIYDNAGLVSNIRQTGIEVTEPEECSGTVQGESGLTITTHQLPNKAGKVAINYTTYSIPDRIDVFYDGQWVGGTGTAPANGIPPASNCYDGTAGYVGKTGVIEFNYSPQSGKPTTFEVYAYGCFGADTAWMYSITCP
jgi:hypothetical protein